MALESGTGSSACGEAWEVCAITHASRRSFFAIPGYILLAWLSACPGR